MDVCSESKIDEKGRICIPIEIRKRLKINLGEKMFFQVKEDKIILRKARSVDDFIAKSEAFSEKLREATKEPIEFKKMFE